MYAIHDGDEMLHGGWLGWGYLILVVIKSGQGIGGTLALRHHSDGRQKEFPTTTRKRTQADGPTTLHSLVRQVIGWLCLRREAQKPSRLSLSLFLLIATIHGRRILRRGLPLPLLP
jgi:hypothetical protein